MPPVFRLPCLLPVALISFVASANPTPATGVSVNSSIRGELGARPPVLGTVESDGYRVILFHAVRPGLARFAVEDTATDAAFALFDPAGLRPGGSRRMSELSDAKFALVSFATAASGAFELERTSNDSVALVAVARNVRASVARAARSRR